MRIVNREVRDFTDRKESDNLTLLTIKKMDRLISFIKVSPGNLRLCFRRIAKEFDCDEKSMHNLYYKICKPHLATFISVVTEHGSTTGNTKNQLS